MSYLAIWFSVCADSWDFLSQLQKFTFFFVNEFLGVSVSTVLELLLVPLVVVLPFSMPAVSPSLVLPVVKVML